MAFVDGCVETDPEGWGLLVVGCSMGLRFLCSGGVLMMGRRLAAKVAHERRCW